MSPAGARMMKRLLLVEDNEEVRRQLRWGFSEEGYTVLVAGSVDEARAIQDRKHPQVITLDLGLPPDPEGSSEGYRALTELLAADPQARIIVVTGHHDMENALRCIRSGAYDFCRKPVALDELKVIVRRAFYLHEVLQSRKPDVVDAVDVVDADIICQCEKMREVMKSVGKVAASDAPVLITGESGTGKELVARAIHRMSGRGKGPLIAINCGAIPEQLLEAELFGHEKGAFTGAQQQVLGKVEYADGGTLFLDEIGELPPQLQVKLLRFLQEMIIQRVGGRKDIPVNVRVIAATNTDLATAIRSGQFREDLYYRIGVVTIHLPPLRERGQDILLLANSFLRKFDTAGKISGLHPSTEKAMLLYPWPGNVRELENKIRRAIIFAGGSLLGLEDMSLGEPDFDSGGDADAVPLSLREARSKVERKLLLTALNRHSGNIVQAAQAMGISRPTFYDLLKKHSIEI